MGNPEFQAIIMAAGKGSRMTELTTRKTKCLLPIGNLPMIWYPIHLLEKALFQEVIIVVLDPVKNEVQAAVDKCGFRIKVELVGIPAGEDWGTADTLRHLQDSNKIKADIVVVSSDLIADVSLAPLFDKYRKHNAALAALFVQNTNPSISLPTPGPKTKDKTERDFIAINGPTSRLVFIASSSDYEDYLPLSLKILKKYGATSLHSRLLDAHVYILSKWLCQYLSQKQNRSISTLKGEFLSHVVKKQLIDAFRPKYDQDKASIIEVDTQSGVDIMQLAQETELTYKIRSLSTYSDSRCQPVYNNDVIRCYAHVVSNNSYAVRANTIQQYCRVNREILERWNALTNNKEFSHISPSAAIKSTQLDKETCLVGEKSQIAEKTSIKCSLIGPNVIIGTKTRVLNSVIMNGVQIGEGCTIENCIICDESIIEEGCDLKDCLIGSHHTVLSSGKHTNEVLTDMDHLMEI